MTLAFRAVVARTLAAAFIAGAPAIAPAQHQPPQPPTPPTPPTSAAPAPAEAINLPGEPPADGDSERSTDSSDRPGAARRTVHIFDFEEHRPTPTTDPNPDPVPRNWVRAYTDDRPPGAARGFPAWNLTAFDRSRAHGGEASVKLPTRGGSTRLRLEPGVIPVFPRADYLVTARVRTDGLRSARAFLVARFVDANLRPIPGSEARSAPIASPSEWTGASVNLRGIYDDAVFLQLDLELLQQDHFDPPAPAQRALRFEDIDGAAWFDDVSIFLIPRTDLFTTAPANTIIAPERPVLRYLVRDMVGDALTARLTITDIDNRTVAAATIPADPSGKALEWAPTLNGFGWYSATLDVLHGDEPVGKSATEFIYLPAAAAAPAGDSARADRGRFGLIADDPATADALGPWPPFLPRVIARSGTGFIVLPVADPAAPLGSEDEPAAAPPRRRSTVLDSLLQQRQDVTLSFSTIPAAAAHEQDLASSDVLTLVLRDEPVWLPILAPLLEDYGQRILRWQLGPTGIDAAVWSPSVANALDRYRSAVARFVPGPIMSVPWRADMAWPDAGTITDSAGPEGLALLVPHSLPADAVAGTLGPWLAPSDGTAGPDLTVVLDLPPADSSGHREAAAELIKRTAELWAATSPIPMNAGPPAASAPTVRLAIDAPWRPSPGPTPQPLPGAHLAVWRTLIDHLAGRRYITDIPIADGVRCLVFADRGDDRDAPTRGVAVAWNQSAPPEQAVLHAYVCDGPLWLIDLFGNRTPISPNDDAARIYTIPIPQTPVFIEGIDPNIARLISSFRIDPPFARAVSAEHEHALILENPWPVRVTGRLQIVEPADGRRGWTISPAGVIPISIAPNSTHRVPVTFSFGPGEEAGTKTFTVRIQLTADRPLPALELKAPLDIGLPDLDFTPELIITPPDSPTPDAILVVTITNTGQRTRTLNVDAFAPGFPTQQQPISNLAPGESARRRFTFKAAAAAMAGKRIAVSVSDIDAPERLNKSVRVP